MSVTAVILPKLGLTMDEGRMVAWLKKEGDRIEAGEILFEVETDKATMEVEAPVGGYVRRLLASVGDEVPVTQVIALIASTLDEPLGEQASGDASAGTGVAVGRAAAGAQAASTGSPGSPMPAGERIVASPAARKRARELGVDLATVRAHKGDRISVEDVEAVHAVTKTVPLSRMRRAIADSMTHAFRDVPQFSMSRDVDMTAANEVRRAAGASWADVLISATARTLRDHPRLAMRYEENGLVPAEGIHLGIAVAVDDGLLVPVLRDADTKDLAALARERTALQAGARTGKLSADALTGAVFTISNLGAEGIDRFTAIVNPPEAAILAVGRVRDQIVARDGIPVVAPVVTLTLSVDHRVADGTHAAAFLADLAGRLEKPRGAGA